jgi:hypothetical protein
MQVLAGLAPSSQTVGSLLKTRQSNDMQFGNLAIWQFGNLAIWQFGNFFQPQK